MYSVNHKTLINISFKMFGLINRNTKDFRNSICLKTSITPLVSSNLDFSSVIWFSNYSTLY